MPCVSVIIPAFNAEEHLEEALRSVQSQTYGDWEIVVCDDCSTDATAERVRSFSDKGFSDRVTLVRAETNSGPAVARNLAIAHSSGELLALLDADDYWLPAYLERQVSLYDSGKTERDSVGIVACNAAVLRADGLRSETYMDIVRCPREVTLLRLLQANPIFPAPSSHAAPWTRSEDSARSCPAHRTSTFVVRIVEVGYRVVATREVLAVHRIRPKSWSSDVGLAAHYSQMTYRRALERGNLTRRERRVARRELRRRRLIERVACGHRLSYRRTLRALPLLLLVVAERPHRWRSLPRVLARGRNAISPLRS